MKSLQRFLFTATSIVLLSSPGLSQNLTPDIYGWYLNTSGITGYNGLPANVQQVRYSATYVYVSCSGIPAYSIGPWPGNPNTALSQNFVFKIARSPQVNNGTKTATPLGHIGVLVNGVSIFNAKDAMSYNNQNVWHQNAVVVEAPSFDGCLGHPQQQGEYHHHQIPQCLLSPGDTAHSPLMGYAFDGYPIYGPYAYANTNGTGGIARMKSGYRKRAITQRTTLPDGSVLSPSQYGPSVSGTYPLGYYVEDFEYVPGLGDLDEYNGRSCVTPEYPGGTYAYFSTIDSAGNSEYPYLIGPDYYGVVISGNTGPGGGHVTVSEPVTSFRGVVAYDSNDSTREDSSTTIRVSAQVSASLTVSYAILSNPGHGILSGTLPSVSYQPGLHYVGADTFLFTASVAGGVSDTGMVSLVVRAAISPPTGLSAFPGNQAVTLRWNQNPEPDFLRYRIYFDTNPHPAVPTDSTTNGSADTVKTINGLTDGTTYHFRITAVDSAGLESQYSDEISATPGTFVFMVRSRWNIVSVPVDVGDSSKTALFPNAISHAFAYEGVYVPKDTLGGGRGYWVKFSAPQTIAFNGAPRETLAVAVGQGWNLIGSIGSSIPASTITSQPGGMITSSFFGYAGAYSVADSIKPGNGYWVKTNQPGTLFLSSGPTAGSNRIKIIATSEPPPSPPGESNSGDPLLPTRISLEQNYPNPFNPRTTITFELPGESFVSLRVYDILGSEVAVLVNNKLTAGKYDVAFNASQLTSGVYYCRLQAGSITETTKLIFLR